MDKYSIVEFIKLNLLFLLLICPSISIAQQALVRSYSDPAQPIGQAFLTHYGDNCLALLPTHVVKESGTPAFLHEGNSLLGESDNTTDLGEDLSIAEVGGSITKDCGFSISTISRAVGSLIKGQGVATLRSINSDGSIARLAVAIIDDDGSLFLRVRPTNDKVQIRKGHSGSLLMINDQPVGMLLAVNAKHGIGKILRMDVLLAKAETYMTGNRPQLQDNKSNAPSESPAKNISTATDNEGGVLGWNVLPVDSEHRATNLTDADSSLPWRAKVDKWPVEIELDVAGGKVAISQIVLNGNGIKSEELPQQIEIFINVSKEKRRWRSLLGRKASFDKNGIATFSFAPTWARQIKIVIRNNIGGKKIISLKRIRIINS